MIAKGLNIASFLLDCGCRFLDCRFLLDCGWQSPWLPTTISPNMTMLIVDRNISFSDYSSAVNSCLAFLFTKDFFPHCSLVLQQSQGHTSFLVLFWILPQWLLCFTDCYHQSHKRAIGHAAFQPFGSREYSVLLSSIRICNQCTIFFFYFQSPLGLERPLTICQTFSDQLSHLWKCLPPESSATPIFFCA